jgi:hypothetical protein
MPTKLSGFAVSIIVRALLITVCGLPISDVPHSSRRLTVSPPGKYGKRSVNFGKSSAETESPRQTLSVASCQKRISCGTASFHACSSVSAT